MLVMFHLALVAFYTCHTMLEVQLCHLTVTWLSLDCHPVLLAEDCWMLSVLCPLEHTSWELC